MRGSIRRAHVALIVVVSLASVDLVGLPVRESGAAAMKNPADVPMLTSPTPMPEVVPIDSVSPEDAPPLAGDRSWVPKPAGKGKGFDAARSTAVPSLTTDRREVFSNPDGSFTARVSPVPVRVPDGAGGWRPVDLALRADGKGDLVPGASPVGLTVPIDPKQGMGRVTTPAGVLSVGLPDVAAEVAAPKVDAAGATFAGVAGGPSVLVAPTVHGFESSVVFDSPGSAKASYQVTVTLPDGVSANDTGDGVVFTDRTGATLATAGGGVARDATHVTVKAGGVTGSAAVEAPVRVRLVAQVGASVSLEYAVDPEWLADPGRVFPVVLDPTIWVYAASGGAYDDTYVNALEDPPVPHYDSLDLRAGTYGRSYSKALMYFDLGAYAGADVAVTDAYLTVSGAAAVYADETLTTCYAQNQIELYALGAAFGPSTQWSDQPPTDGKAPWRSQTMPIGDPNPNVSCGFGPTAMNVTALVQAWMRTGRPDTKPNFGLQLRAPDGDPATGVLFYSGETWGAPRLDVTYLNVPDATAVAPADKTTVGVTTPRLQVSAPSSNPNLQCLFRIANGNDAETGVIAGQSAWQGCVNGATWTVPADTLTDGQTYSWHTWTRDSTNTAAMVMAPWVRTFTVNRRFGTSGPSPFDAIGPVSVNLATGNITYQTSSPSFPTVAGSLGVSYTYNSLRRATHGLVASYYNDPGPTTHLSGTPVITRTEARVSHAWAAFPPTPDGVVHADQFSTRWTGYLTVPTAGAYRLGGSADDGFRVRLDTGSGLRTILNEYAGVTWPTRNYSPALNLTANQPYKLEIDYYDVAGNAYISFEGTGPNGFDGVVPSGWLTPDPPALPAGWSVGPDLDGRVGYVKAVASGSNVALTSPDGRVESWVSTGSGWVPPAGADGVLTGTPGGTLTLAAADGQLYTFGSDGELVSITSASELKKPTGAEYAWTQTVDGLNRMDRITDPVSARAITLTYGTAAGTDPCPTNGSSARPPAGMLCKLDYAQLGGGQTSLYYNGNGQLARIEDPGSEETDFAYDGSGRLSTTRDALAADAIAAGLVPDDSTAATVITYKAATDASYPSWATGVTLPDPRMIYTTAPWRSYAYTWYGVGVTDVHAGGASEPYGWTRRVWYSSGTSDDSRRMLRSIDAANLSTIYTYDNTADAVATTTDPAGFESTTIYDARQRPIESYGPAPTTCYGTDNKPLASLPAGCPNPVPRSTTAYDEGVKGLAATYWDNADLAGAPKAMVTGVGEVTGKLAADWGTAAPNPEVGVDNWSARYSGDVTFTQTGQYSLRVDAADTAGVKLSVDGTQIASHWNGPNHPEVVSPFPNHRDMFMRGPDDALWHRSWDAAGGQWSEWETLGGVLTSDPGACVRGTSGRIDVFVRGTDAAVWQRYLDVDGWHPWYRVGGVAVGAPDCASWDRDHVALFVHGTDDALWVNRWTGGPAWIGFWNRGGTLTSDPAAVSWGKDRYDVFVRGAGNEMYHNWSTDDGAGWQPDWENQHGNLSAAPAVAAWATNRLDVFIRDQNNTLETKWWDGQAWQPVWVPLDGILTTAPGVVSSFPGTLAVFTRGTDDQLYEKDYNTVSGWGAWGAKGALFRTGKFTVTDASKPYRIAVELADRGGTANVGLRWQAPGGSMVDVPGAQLNARYGLATSSVDPDGRKVATGYTDQGLDPALGFPTAVRADPDGLNLTTRTRYETTYYRRNAKALPQGDLTDANKRITVTNYLGTGDTGSGGAAETRALPTNTGCQTGTVNQGGLPKKTIDAMPASTATQTWHETIYDPAGRIAATRERGDTRWTCVLYDARGRVTDTTDRAGHVTHTQYWGAPADPTCGSVEPYVICTRYVDSAGATRSTRTETDWLGRVWSYTDEQGTQTLTGYDQLDRPYLAWRALPGEPLGLIGTAAYDTYNRLQSSSEFVSTSGGRAFTYGYDSVGRPTTLDRPTSTYPVRTTTGYDATTGRVSSLVTTRNTATQWVDGYVYSSAGKMTVDWSSVALHQYAYDTVGRLVTATDTGTRNYAFDANTNRCANATSCATPTFTYDNADRLTGSPSGTAYVYDTHGNLTSYTKTGGGTVTLVYDAYDHATRIDDGTTRVEETLAPSGRVLRRTVTSPPGGTITEDKNYGYPNSGDSPGWARNVSGGTVTTYLPAEIITGTTPSYQITNTHGDIVGTTTQAGTFTATPATDEYGVAASVPSTRLGWLGAHERFTTHASLGIIRMGQRLYDPNLGRFLQQDPIEAGSANDYDYVSGDPVNALDLAGTFEYTLDFDLGSSSLSASQYMSTVAANFSSVFPIRGAPRTLPGIGSRVGLRVSKVSFPVTVTKRGPTGWTFGTRAGHPDFPGWVSFNFHKSHGRMHLRVHAYVPDYSPYSIGCGAVSLLCFAFRKRIYRGIASGTWRPFANNLRARVW